MTQERKNFISHMMGLPIDRICSHTGPKHKVCDKLGIHVTCCWWQPVCLPKGRTRAAIFVSPSVSVIYAE